MATITLKSKKLVEMDMWEYTYECFCGTPTVTKLIVGRYPNDNEAQADSQVLCDQYCGQTYSATEVENDA